MADIYTAATGAPNPDSLHPSHRQQPKIVTVPCKYRAGRVLGHGTYAVVKEMIHIDTGVHYAGKVINKKHMRGREQAIPNEINILKRLSRKHPNVLTLYDYFETPHNVYLITELCTGGELFERICKETAFTEQDASRIIRQIVEGVSFLHQNSVVHRDLKTENCLFRTSERESEVAIADFGLSKIINEGSNYALMTHCGTPGYMAPEVVQRLGHGKPVDMWAVGVIAYFILSGTTPFEREDPKAEAVAVVKCDYSFEPLEHWCHISPAAQHFIASLLVYDPAKRITAKQALAHPWLQGMKRMVMPPVSPSLPRVFQSVVNTSSQQQQQQRKEQRNERGAAMGNNDSGYETFKLANDTNDTNAHSDIPHLELPKPLPPTPTTPDLSQGVSQFRHSSSGGGAVPQQILREASAATGSTSVSPYEEGAASGIPKLHIEEVPMDSKQPLVGIGISIGVPIIKTKSVHGGEEIEMGSRNLIPGLSKMARADRLAPHLKPPAGSMAPVDERTSHMNVDWLMTPGSSGSSAVLSARGSASDHSE